MPLDQYLEDLKSMLAFRGYSKNTIQAYCTYISAYLEYVPTVLEKPVDEVTWTELRGFLTWIQESRHLSDVTFNYIIAYLKFFYLYVLHKEWDPYQVPKRKVDVPVMFIPTQETMYYFLSSFQPKEDDDLTTLKCKVAVVLMYSAGLRSCETVNLRYEDISRSTMKITVQESKNHFGRRTILSRYALQLLTYYWRKAGKPKGYLFPSPKDPEKSMNTNYINKAIAKHEAELGWPHKMTCHTLRRAFGTHCYENGVDLLAIKELMGHKSLNSTLRYVRMSKNYMDNIESPLDVYNDRRSKK